MRSHRSLSTYSRNFSLLLTAVLSFGLIFAFYLHSERALEMVRELRTISYALSDELRQSSADLTRLARSYVATGDPVYKRSYHDILAIREGKQARPAEAVRLDGKRMTLPSAAAPSDTVTGTKIALLDLMRMAGFSDAEFAKLVEAKNNSDTLTATELSAMHLIETSVDYTSSDREKATRMLFDGPYLSAKAAIKKAIDDTYILMDQRTAQLVLQTEKLNEYLRAGFMFIGILFLFLLWRSYRALLTTMGAPLEEIYYSLTQLGGDSASDSFVVQQETETSIKAWIVLAQKKLAKTAAENQEVRAKNLRLTRLYTMLSQCNQAIVRSHSEQELFDIICRDAVVFGGMKMAWIGMQDEQSLEFKAVAHFGEGAHYMAELTISHEPNEQGVLGPISNVLQTGTAYWCQDIAKDQIYAHWHRRSLAAGWQSMAILPLHRHGKTLGSFNLFLDQVDAFDDASCHLLLEIALDISHALNRFELEESRRLSLQMEGLRTYMLERITSASALPEILRDVVLKLELLMPTSICSIVLVDKDGRHLRTGAMPNAPEFFVKAIDGIEIAAGVGSCGNAIATGQRTIAADLSQHPFWVNYTSLTAAAGLGACWSEPIFAANGQVLGAFAIYHRQPGMPQDIHLHLLEMAAHFIAIVVERKQSEESLRKLSQAVEQSSNVIIITDQRARIEYVNAAFLRNSGKALHEVLGKRPILGLPGRSLWSTYKEMFTELKRGQSWQRELSHIDQLGVERIDAIDVSPIRDAAGGITHFLFVEEDITEKKRSEERIQYLAHFDPLTGLVNRSLLEERARLAIAHAARAQQQLAVLLFDLDHFKDINDTLGHSSGDALLVELAKRLTANFRSEDTIARLGGDEFVLILPGIDGSGVEAVLEKLMPVISDTYRIGGHELNVTTSIGIAIYPDDGGDLETLSKNADAAMYRAKREGRNAYRFFTQEMQARSARHLDLVNAMRHALAREQFSLHYQPQLAIASGAVIGAEALLRWQHPALGMIAPSEFIPLAEENGMILEIGEWVIRSAVWQLKAWHERGYRQLRIAVNLSAVQFRHADLPALITRILQAAQLAPEFLELELTESVAMHDPDGAIAIMNNLSARGVRMSIDDFGTGYSSLSYLKKFKVYKLKIDRSFVRDIHTDPEDKAIVSAVIGMAKSLGLTTIAEGVETSEQLDFLRQQGCLEVQGYLFARPMAAEAFEQFMASRRDPQAL
ncbi:MULTISPECIES: EAL domain-containing protein [unclassified Undibacterium]|uniref:sensor domain-containing phosphodiesterase n=1 Tax=unclassified Undibacterium TaxID=2630295 RepID=UPI002AC90570|nr:MULTISPECIES: EAL domain-containing protein [unclassified Undibacterium]MEB0137446.1 EAL domain-containing protein [Undibacterium sp. CCC2.1]MEB0170889.1 EAL domain-containing protein [Undibacterium sp. CCC1.1]MEB0174841.1 EAL domain-containing protein [Undibacterium sp. CCC3.4]MEB0214177.1 EAL domain-containing protein [Undibacterium sp. 5I2]WPX44489.1 EAL domain-containing protein [Undibacterium sp. CCC3.4]